MSRIALIFVMDNCHESFPDVDNALKDICNRVDDMLMEHKQRLQAHKKNNELNHKVASELQCHEQLSSRLASVNGRRDELRRVCARLGRLEITAGDTARLEHARDVYELGKRLTGVRWDFTAGEQLAKGYAQNRGRLLLRTFEAPEPAHHAVWDAIASVADPVWGDLLPD